MVDCLALFVATFTTFLTFIAIGFRATLIPIVAKCTAENIVIAVLAPATPCGTADYIFIFTHVLYLLIHNYYIMSAFKRGIFCEEFPYEPFVG